MKKIMTQRLYYGFLLSIAITSFSINSTASDHVDGEALIEHPIADISDLYAFPSPQAPNHLVVILNSYPFVPSDGHFSDQLTYSFLIKPIAIGGTGVSASFIEQAPHLQFDCRVSTPHNTNHHAIECTTLNGHKIQGKINQTIINQDQSIKLFAGKRKDPFLFSANWFSQVVFDRCIPPANATSDLNNANVLSIVLEIDVDKIFTKNQQGLLAIAAQISYQAEPYTIIDRVGRPEISNAHLVAELTQDDLRPLYNQENTFSLTPSHKEKYKERLQENITYYDQLDKQQDWNQSWQQSLINILIDDYLVVDMTKPFSQHSYFEIENALLRSQPHTRSGGRVPGDRVINQLMTTLINGGNGAAINDGIAAVAMNQQFPYLPAPNSGIISKITSFFAPKVIKPISLQKRDLNTKQNCE